MTPRFKKLLLLFVLLCMTAYLLTQTNAQEGGTDADFGTAFTPYNFPSGDFNLHYVDSGNIGKPTIVFIHGTPGSLRSMRRVMADPDLLSAARLISIDRPGWGQSALPEGQRSEADFNAQIALITPLLYQLKQESNDQPLLLVGHSYGGSIAPYIAFRHPALIDAIVMAASAIDPELGKPRWYNRAANTWLVSRFLDDALLKANDEIKGVYDALEQLRPWWAGVTMPMVFVQGEDDSLVDPRNLDFAQQYLPPNNTKIVRLPNQGHLLQVQQYELLAQLTLSLLGQVTQ